MPSNKGSRKNDWDSSDGEDFQRRPRRIETESRHGGNPLNAPTLANLFCDKRMCLSPLRFGDDPSHSKSRSRSDSLRQSRSPRRSATLAPGRRGPSSTAKTSSTKHAERSISRSPPHGKALSSIKKSSSPKPSGRSKTRPASPYGKVSSPPWSPVRVSPRGRSSTKSPSPYRDRSLHSHVRSTRGKSRKRSVSPPKGRSKFRGRSSTKSPSPYHEIRPSRGKSQKRTISPSKGISKSRPAPPHGKVSSPVRSPSAHRGKSNKRSGSPLGGRSKSRPAPPSREVSRSPRRKSTTRRSPNKRSGTKSPKPYRAKSLKSCLKKSPKFTRSRSPDSFGPKSPKSYRSKTQAPPTMPFSGNTKRPRTSSVSKSPKPRARAKTVSLKSKHRSSSSSSNGDSDVKPLATHHNKKRAKTVERELLKSKETKVNKDDEREKKNKRKSLDKGNKNKRKEYEIDSIARVHYNQPYFKPPGAPSGANRNKFIKCRICSSYYKDDMEQSNNHISLHRNQTFCVKVPRDTWFYDIEDAIAHLAVMNFSKAELKEKVTNLNLIEYPGTLIGFSCSTCLNANSGNVVNFASNEEFLSHVKANKCAQRGAEEEVRVSWCRGCHTRFLTKEDLLLHTSKKKKKCFPTDDVINRVFLEASQKTTSQTAVKTELSGQPNIFHSADPRLSMIHAPLFPPMTMLNPGIIQQLPPNPADLASVMQWPGYSSSSSSSSGLVLPPGLPPAPVTSQHSLAFKPVVLPSSSSCSSLSESLQPPHPTMSMACSPIRQVESFNVYEDFQQVSHSSQGSPTTQEITNAADRLLNSSTGTLEGILKSVHQKSIDERQMRKEKELEEIRTRHSRQLLSSRTPPHTLQQVPEVRRMSEEAPSSFDTAYRQNEDEDDDCLAIEQEADKRACDISQCMWSHQHDPSCKREKIIEKCGRGECSPDDLHQCWGFKYNRFLKHNKFLKKPETKNQLCPKLSFYANHIKKESSLVRDKKTPIIPIDRIKSESPSAQELVDPRLRVPVYPSIQRPYKDKMVKLKHPQSRVQFLFATLNSSDAMRMLIRNSN